MGTLDEALSAKRIESLTTEFCSEFPARAAGSEGERRAAEAVAGLMKGAGLQDVRIEQVEFDLVRARSWQARDGAGRSLAARPLLGVPECRDLDLPVVDVGRGTAADYERLRAAGAPLEGTAHLAWRGGQGPGTDEMDRFEKQHYARLNGAAAWVHAMDVARAPAEWLPDGAEAPPPLEGGLGAIHDPLPAISLAAADARGLERIRLDIDSSEEPLTTWVVHGELRGTGDGEVILGAQLDAVEWARYGAPYDNGAGIAIALLLAEAFAGAESLRRTLTVCAFGGEEAGTIGSRHFTAERMDEPERVAAMVNLDSLTQREGWVGISSYGRGSFGEGAFDRNGPYGGNPDTRAPGSLAARLLAAIESVGYPSGRAYLPGRTEWTSDHYPFAAAGIPSVWAFKKPAIFHCEYDTLGMMDWDDASLLARAHAALLTDLLAGRDT